MLPPRHPHSSHVLSSDHTPIINGNQRQNGQNNNRFASSSLDSRSHVSKYQHLRTTQDKRKALGKRRYINQLAYLDYQDKQIQIHTKNTMVSKVTAMKKIKAKNLLADFVDEQQQIELGFQELMDYKYGRKSGNGDNFYFEKSQLINEYVFCPECDTIHNDHHEVHKKICRQKVMMSQQSQQYDKNSQFYVFYSLQRIINALQRTIGQEYDQLKFLVKKFIQLQQNPNHMKKNNSTLQITHVDLQKYLKQINQIKKTNLPDYVLKQVANKILKLYNPTIR